MRAFLSEVSVNGILVDSFFWSRSIKTRTNSERETGEQQFLIMVLLLEQQFLIMGLLLEQQLLLMNILDTLLFLSFVLELGLPCPRFGLRRLGRHYRNLGAVRQGQG
jgi:hypothetical protein